MPRGNTQRSGSKSGPQLSRDFLQKLGVDAASPRSVNQLSHRSLNRKEQRKHDRAQQKATNVTSVEKGQFKVSQGDSAKPKKIPASEKRPKPPQSRSVSAPFDRNLRNDTSALPITTSSEVSSFDSRSPSPGLVLDRSSRAFKERAAHDDEEISALEKKLGLKSEKLPKSFDEDGLGEILDGLESDTESKKRKREGQDWLMRKRRAAHTHDDQESVYESEGDDLSSDVDEFSHSSSDDSDGFSGFSEDIVDETRPPLSKKRENPYIAPGSEASTAKYVPPSLRKVRGSETELLHKIRRQIQGHLNKLSEANIITILNEIEVMYQSNARQDVTVTLIDLLLSLFGSRSSLQNTFVILHAAFIAAIYKIIGTAFGAELVAKLIIQLDGCLEGRFKTSGKESNNLISLLSYLFTFNVINSVLVYNYLEIFLRELSETNAELILRVVRDCGPQLRHDDPTSLKTIVQLMYEAKARSKANGIELSVRTDFMTKTIEDLKNNKMRVATNDAGIASEHITQMRKVLGTLNKRSLQASEPLRISRDDIKNSDKKGKWWLIGASWKGEDENPISQSDISHMESTNKDINSDEVDLWTLAKQYRMNTDVRRSIFISLMSAYDVEDAYMRIIKLRLKRAQEQEIPKVILRCVGAERPYNSYYFHVAKRLCSDKKMKMAFQFAIWNFFKRLGEDEKGAERHEEDVVEAEYDSDIGLEEIVNLGKIYAELILDGVLNLTLLKVLNLTMLKEQCTIFLEVLLITILNGLVRGQTPPPTEKALVEIFSKVADAPHLLRPLQFFIKRRIRKSDLVAETDRTVLKRNCTIATDTLLVLETPSLALD